MIGVVLAAAGSGSRFGADTPKQFALLRGKPLYFNALECFSPFFSQCVVVVPRGWEKRVENHIQSLPYRKKLILETGGPERQDSVYRGLCRLSEQVRIVLVHDAARPFISSALIARIIEGVRRHRACIPALAVGETVKEVRQGRVVKTLDRRHLQRAQTPQGFEVDLVKKAFEQAKKEGFYGTDESMLVERLGLTVHVVEGEPENRKITWKEDLAQV